jgi:hypothetical protein
MITFLVFLSGLLLSVSAAYYSIVGLIAIFPGATFAIAAMGSTLELSKLVAVSWLYRNWKPSTPFWLRAYLSIAILLLMFITSMGIFGFLSKAHLEHSLTAGADVSFKIDTVDQKIEAKQRAIDSVDKQISIVDRTYERYVELGSLTKGLEQKANIDAQRNALEKERDVIQTELLTLKEERNRLVVVTKQQEVEVGPLKYIAELIYGDQAKDHFDKAVRMVIILLIIVFDPLAVMLLIAGNISLMEKPPKKETVAISKKRSYNRNSKEESDVYVIPKSEWSPRKDGIN